MDYGKLARGGPGAIYVEYWSTFTTSALNRLFLETHQFWNSYFFKSQKLIWKLECSFISGIVETKNINYHIYAAISSRGKGIAILRLN
jgi:hypothetical protein